MRSPHCPLLALRVTTQRSVFAGVMSLAGAKAYLLLLFYALVCVSCQAEQFHRSGEAWKYESLLSRQSGTQDGGYGASFRPYPHASSSGDKTSRSSVFNGEP